MNFKAAHCFCCCSVAKSYLTLCDPMDCNMPGFPVLHYLPEFAQTHIPRVSDATQLSHPLSPPSPPALNYPQHQGFSNFSCLNQAAKVLELQCQSSSEYSGLISVKTDWFDLLVVQGTLKSLLQQHSWKASILQHSTFFMVQSSPWATENISKTLISNHSDRVRK